MTAVGIVVSNIFDYVMCVILIANAVIIGMQVIALLLCCGVWYVLCGVWCVVCGMSYVVCGVWLVGYGVV